MVADHLSVTECRKLSEALRHKEFLLMNNVTGSQEPNKTCIYLLLMWDRTDGKGRTFEDLDLRLRQIGRTDIANKLSVAVLHEDAVELNKKIMNDPFKDMIPKDSVLLDAAGDTIKLNIDKREYSEPELIGSWEIIYIIIGLVSVVVLLVLSFRFLCPGFVGRVWRKYAPDLVVDWCDLWRKECDICCRNCSNDYSFHVIGSSTKLDDV
ncbi:hypothetical protein ACJMK2_034698 [Sinanodonta woodiana]|uniref:Death domain-containing protein n=1 Tax=Sinanodonta woodiana TaxID=1069815 RepID=A0ABD3WSF9_SINWO